MWLALAAAYLGFGLVTRKGATPGFDSLEPRGRHVEAAIREGRFAEALPAAASLRTAYPNDVIVLQWLAEIHRGLGDNGREIATLRDLARVTAWSDMVCPALPAALDRGGDPRGALVAYEECARRAPDAAGRLIDLADAQQRGGDLPAAKETFESAKRLTPLDRLIDSRLSRSPEGADR